MEKENGEYNKWSFDGKYGCVVNIVAAVILLIFIPLNDDPFLRVMSFIMWFSVILTGYVLGVYMSYRQIKKKEEEEWHKMINGNPIWKELRKYAYPNLGIVKAEPLHRKVSCRKWAVRILKASSLAALVVLPFNKEMTESFATDGIWGGMCELLAFFLCTFLLISFLGILMLIICAMVLWTAHKAEHLFNKVYNKVKREWNSFLEALIWWYP